MTFTPVRPNDPLDQPSHSGLHNQHSTDIEAAQGEIATLSDVVATLAGGDVGEVLAKTSGDDYDFDWLPGGTGGGPGGEYPGISTEDPNGLGLGTDGGLRVEPSKVLQVVRATDRTGRTTTKTSFEDAGISVTITPQKFDSAILLLWSFLGSGDQGLSPGDAAAHYQITDSSNNAIDGAKESAFRANSVLYVIGSQLLMSYSTPATTSATTYKGRFKSANADSTAHLYNAATTGQMYAIELADVVVSP